MKIFVATDHAGFELKEKIKEFLTTKGHKVVDCGAFEYDKDDDYPDFIGKAAKEVSNCQGSVGIVLGKSGAGECIVANKIKGIRAFLAINEENVRLAREHNDANIMSIGSEFVTQNIESLIEVFLKTPFSNEERHTRRINKIKQLEQNA